MKTERAKQLKIGDQIFYAGSFYEVSDLSRIKYNFVGIYDEPPSKHIDYLNVNNVSEVVPCHNCQGGGCFVCAGYGTIVY